MTPSLDQMFWTGVGGGLILAAIWWMIANQLKRAESLKSSIRVKRMDFTASPGEEVKLWALLQNERLHSVYTSCEAAIAKVEKFKKQYDEAAYGPRPIFTVQIVFVYD